MSRVALVDDHDVVAVALDSAVRACRGLVYIGAAPTVDALLERHGDAELVVLDLRLTDGSSPANNVARLVDAGMNVVVFTSGESPALVRAAARTPALGIVRKSAPLSSLVEMLERAAQGQPSMSTDLAAAIETDPTIGHAALTDEETRVLALFARGLKTQVVAKQLGIAASTVDEVVRRIRAKYADEGRPADTTVDLYIRAVEDGILPFPLGNA